MIYLIGHMAVWLFLIAVAAGVAGWMAHALRRAEPLARLERERDRLRGELLSFVRLEGAARGAGDDPGLEALRMRESVLTARVRELDSALGEAREQRDAAAGRVAELERARAAAPAIARIVEPRQPREAREDADVLGWRLRYFEARTRYLEQQARAAPPAPSAPLALPAPPAEETPHTDETAALKWRARYLEARVRYLESRPAPEADSEATRRAAWRARYLDARLAHLRAHEADELMAARGRLADLEASAVGEPARYKWRARYLDARVRHLEARMGEGAAPVAPAPEAEAELPMETPALVPPGAEVRPPALGAPRAGAPDDLRLIHGVGPKIETQLHALGVFHFDQIAAWSRANVAWVDQYLRFRGRIVREGWVAQAEDLMRSDGPRARRGRLEAA